LLIMCFIGVACSTYNSNRVNIAVNNTELNINNKFIVGQVWINKDAPTILISHGCTGVSKHEHDWAYQIASWGFNAVVVDSLKGRGIHGVICKTNRLYPYKRRKELYELAEIIYSRSKAPVGLIGFSHGGALVLHVAIDDENRYIKSAVAYYPNCGAWARADERAEPRHPTLPAARPNFFDTKIPVALMYGGEDDWTPYFACEDVVQGKLFEPHVFKYATHGFDMKGPNRRVFGHYLRYDEKADVESRKLTREFFERTLSAPKSK